MSAFDPAWLALREPADCAARARVLERLLCRHLGAGGHTAVADLGAGTGANVRHLAPALGGAQTWWLVDADTDLLDHGLAAVRAWARDRGAAVTPHASGLTVRGDTFSAEVRPHPADLAHDPLPVPAPDLVTASALLDLVSRAWLDRLAAACAAAGTPALFALTVTGDITWEPPAALDAEVRELVARHQRGDKGFGPALGADAVAAAETAFTAHGYGVETARSPWRLGPGDAHLQQHLHAGWMSAAAESAPDRAPALHGWLAHRMDLLAGGVGHVTVDHADLLALPAA